MAAAHLGPTLKASICTTDLNASIDAWCDSLQQNVVARDTVSAARAEQWRMPILSGAKRVTLANKLGEAWLEFIELPDATVVDPFGHSGWFSLEINVEDVDRLRSQIDEKRFTVIGEPANLDFSDDIRAMQLTGPAGEVIYLTQIKAEVPPFELPFARCEVDRLFIPVLLCHDREKTLSFYQDLNQVTGLQFETKITIINQARNMDPDFRNPVATIQLAGNNLIEMDQLADLGSAKSDASTPGSGILAISFAIRNLPKHLHHYRIEEGVYANHQAAMLRGEAGEIIELIETGQP